MIWTAELISDLSRLWSTGLSASKIGKELGLTKGQVIGKADRLGLERRKVGRVKLVRPIPAPSPPKPPIALVEVSVLQDIDRVAYLDLRDRHCRWIIGESAGVDTVSCCRPVASKFGRLTSWCAEHLTIIEPKQPVAKKEAA